MAVFEWLVAQWPLAIGGAVAAMAIAGWVERLKRVQELELRIKQLERAETEQDKRVIVPTSEEIQRYGSAGRRLKHLLRRPDLFLGVIAILGPVLAGLYQMHRVSEAAQRLNVRIAETQSQIDSTDRQITTATTDLKNATDLTLKELSGTGFTKTVGMGPIYRQLLARRDDIAGTLRDLERRKQALVQTRSVLEQKRRELKPIVLHPDGER